MTKKRVITFLLDNKEYQVILKKIKGAKMMRITLGAEASITVTGPLFVSFKMLELFLDTKAAWMVTELQKLAVVPHKKIVLSREEFLAIKETARALVMQKLSFWNQHYNFSWNRVSIRNQKTRFGSCSSQKNLSFHAAIVFLPEKLQDYLIVHELCHLQEMHHQTPFWNLVAKTIVNPKAKSKQLASWGRVASPVLEKKT